MILSQKHNILYVANPKTATTAVQKWFKEEDSSFEKGTHVINGKKIQLREHITAGEAKRLLGEEIYNKLFVIGFVREPISKMISAYNFYKQGGKNHSIWNPGTNGFLGRFFHAIQYLSARLLPMKVWIFIYPYRDNFRYFHDRNGTQIVEHVGRMENLAEDLSLILQRQKVNFNLSKLRYENKSDGKKQIEFSSGFIELLSYRHKYFKKDLEFYRNQSKALGVDEIDD